MYAENTQTDPNQLIQQLSKSVKGRELLEMLEKALKQSDPADLEEDAKYTRRDSNPQPSVPKATLNTGQKAQKLLVFQQFMQFLTRCKLSRLIAVIVGKSRYVRCVFGSYRRAPAVENSPDRPDDESVRST